MAIDARVTILLTLKGRDLYTLRWLWHANRTSLPFPIFIADGEVNSRVARLIEDRTVFPRLQIEYRRYDDRTFYDFYVKLEDALSRIKTAYVMMSDNDDFILPTGVAESVDCLDRRPEYVSVGGGIAHFETRPGGEAPPNLTGRVGRYWYQQARAYRSYDLANPSAAARTYEAYSGFLTVCYNVFRVDALRKMTGEMVSFNFERLDNSELYLILRTATLGFARSYASCISYVRQLGTSSNPARGRDFVVSLSTGRYVEEIQGIAEQIASIVAGLDGGDAEDVREKLDAIGAERLRDKLVAVLGWRASAKRGLKRAAPQGLVAGLKAAGDRFRSGRSSAAGGRPISRDKMVQLVARAGATTALLTRMREELAEVEETMERRDFMAFVEARAPELLRG